MRKMRKRSIDLGSLEWEMIPETEINMAAVSDNMGSKDKDIIMAKENKLDKLAQFGTYEEVVSSEQKTLSTRWVITTKDRNSKARLAIRGFEEKDIEIHRGSPTFGKGAMRLFLSVAALQKWTVKPTDIKSAFLQGKELVRDIYIKTPTESKAPQHIIWKFKHGLNGLKDGARDNFMKV